MREVTYETVNAPEAVQEAVDKAIRNVRQYVPEGEGRAPLTRDSEPDESYIDYGRSVWVGVLMGAVIGGVQGVALLAYVGSPKLTHWGGAFSIPFWSACGWALFGMIVGSGGIFSEFGRKK